jgi:cell division protein FtsI/penicillin-binding protein 2
MNSRNASVNRIRIITGVVMLVGLVLVGRLYFLQIIKFDVYVARGENQYVHTVTDLYDRGTIYFTTRDGEKVSAATVQSGYVMAVDPSRVEDAEELFSILEPYLLINKETFLYRATLPDRVYVEVRSELTEEEAATLKELDLKGVQLHRQRWRYYPATVLAARSIGFVGFEGKSDDEQLVGRYGLERYYEEILSRDRDRLAVNFFAELFTNLGKNVFSAKEESRGDVVTTIEPTVARLLQNELVKIQDRWDSGITGGIIINPKTGEIYAIDAVPSFDPNNRASSTIDHFKNPLVEERYELGSIIKALTMAAGLDSGAVSPSTTYYDDGFLELNTWTISNYDKRGRGLVDMQAVLSQSLNTGVAFIVKTMGKEQFRDYFLKLRLGSETGIDLPGEIHGDVENLNSPREIEYATASYGQGIATTPIAAARALSALGNGGTLISPHLTKRIEYENNTSKDIIFPEGERVWSEKTSEEVTRMLVRVVDEALKGGNAKLPNHSVAAKTGTAQMTNPSGGYYDDRYLHSFFGYFPAYDPQFLIFLYTEDPKDVTYASDTLTDSFMEMTKFLINYYSIPPDR